MGTNNTNARLIKQTPERKVQQSVQSYLKSTDWHIQQPFVNNPGKSQTHDPQAGTSKSVHLPCPHLNHKEEKKHSVSRLVTRWNKTHGLDTYLGALGHPCRSGWEAQKKNREQLTHWWHMSDVLIQEPGLQGPDLPNTRTFRVQLIIIVSLSHSQMALCSLLSVQIYSSWLETDPSRTFHYQVTRSTRLSWKQLHLHDRNDTGQEHRSRY